MRFLDALAVKLHTVKLLFLATLLTFFHLWRLNCGGFFKNLFIYLNYIADLFVYNF